MDRLKLGYLALVGGAMLAATCAARANDSAAELSDPKAEQAVHAPIMRTLRSVNEDFKNASIRVDADACPIPGKKLNCAYSG